VPVTTERRQGTVDRFDDPAGYGTVVDADGRAWFFHCTQIADGTRTIAEGAVVTFEPAAGPMGWEAHDLRRC
jgi:cold shock protein